jgi:ubiquinone/menaquinone biosynthesis C-methylase UbiE
MQDKTDNPTKAVESACEFLREQQRIKSVYSRRAATYRQPHISATRYCDLECARAVKATLTDLELTRLKILDVGCGSGNQLGWFSHWKMSDANLFGVDLMLDRVRSASCKNVVVANATRLPYSPGVFDVVTQFVMLSSVRDAESRHEIAREMMRVLKPTGRILSYDLRINNPLNPEVMSVSKAELQRLFPECTVTYRPCQLLPPLVRALAPVSLRACRVLARLPFLLTHYLAVIRPPAVSVLGTCLYALG